MEGLMKMRLPEDAVSYCLYSKSLFNSDEHIFHNRHIKLDFLTKCLAFFAKETKGHIWQNEGINLKIMEYKQNMSYLKGTSRFGDNIEDEWFIVYLIHKLTETYTDIVASVSDNDGEFLLIEAANHLPRWLTPHTCQNRVFIFHGKVHLILKPQSPADCGILPVTTPSLEQSLSIVFNYPYITQASSCTLSCIGKRIDKYPGKALENIFHANVYLPKKLIYLLDTDRNFISTSVNKFYFRDPIDLRGCRVFNYFPPQDRCWTKVTMMRCQYAQLTQQHFIPDKQSGYKIDSNVSPADVEGYNLGLKIAHGFEIACRNISKSCGSNELRPVDIEIFNNFITKLKNNGYFKKEIEGSQIYNKLYADAEKYFKASCESSTYDSLSRRIFQIAEKYDSEEHVAFQTMLMCERRTDLPQESSKDWMKLSENDINDLVQEMNNGFERMNCKTKKSNSQKFNHDVEGKNLHKFSQKMNQFVDQKSGHEGVEFDSEVSFEPKEFVKSLEDVLGFSNLSKSQFRNEASSSDDDFLTSEEETEDDDNDVEERDKFKRYFQEMENELSHTSVEKPKEDDVEIDFNLVNNFLQGVQHEGGLSGPVSNIIKSLGVNFPKNVDLSN